MGRSYLLFHCGSRPTIARPERTKLDSGTTALLGCGGVGISADQLVEQFGQAGQLAENPSVDSAMSFMS